MHHGNTDTLRPVVDFSFVIAGKLRHPAPAAIQVAADAAGHQALMADVTQAFGIHIAYGSLPVKGQIRGVRGLQKAVLDGVNGFLSKSPGNTGQQNRIPVFDEFADFRRLNDFHIGLLLM